jgi:sodium/bile acid cotransporter 7
LSVRAGSADTGSADTGSAGTESTGTGSTGTESTGTESTGKESADTGSVRVWLDRLHIDPYLFAIVGMVALAAVRPARGAVAAGFGHASIAVIALLFFLHGARLSNAAVWQAVSHWRLHALIQASTFVVFPLLGLAARVLVPGVLPPGLYLGIMVLCTLPSTVQSSIAFTAIAGGNVPAAVCAASASSLLGILVTPLLVGVLLDAHGGVSLGGITGIVLQLLAPFLAGQLARPWISGWLGRHRLLTALADRGSVLLIVYTAFSEGVAGGIWHQIDPRSLAAVLLLDMLLLALVLATTTLASRWLGCSREDEIAIVFCGSKKSLASGIPMVNVLFPAHAAGMIVLPLILFHQIQLMVCATLARRYAARRGPLPRGPAPRDTVPRDTVPATPCPRGATPRGPAAIAVRPSPPDAGSARAALTHHNS